MSSEGVEKPLVDVLAAMALTDAFLDAVAGEPDFEPYFEAKSTYGELLARTIDEEHLEEFLLVRAAFDLCSGPGGRPPAAELLARHQVELPAEAVAALEALLSAEDSLGYVEPREGVTYLTRFSDRRTLPAQNVPVDVPGVFIGRLVELEGRFCLLVSQQQPGPRPSPRRNPESDLLRPLPGVRRILDRAGLRFRSERVLMHLVALMGGESPLPRLDSPGAGPAPKPRIVNADGHQPLITVSYYSVRDLDALARKLCKRPWRIEIEEKRSTDGSLRRLEAVVLRKPRGKAFPPGEVVVAHLSATSRSLRVDTNSSERDMEIRRQLSRIDSGILRFTRTKSTPLESVSPKAISPRQLAKEQRAREKIPRDPAAQEALARRRREYVAWWCDTTIPALGNRKPRTLAKTPAGRVRVLGLLERLEKPGPRPEPDLFDPDLIRAELGLPPRFPVA
jgi:hypothetical protein